MKRFSEVFSNIRTDKFRQNLSIRKSKPHQALFSLIQRLTGFEAQAYRESTLSRRLELRLQATGCRSIQDYLNYVRTHPQEAINFKENLLIHVTRFFRDKSVFTYFERRLLPFWLDNLVARERRLVRVWSVGCASGEEPFTLAMILLQPTRERGLHPLILATDVSPRILARAREALFRKSELRCVPSHYRQLYFAEVKPGLFRLSSELRKYVIFRQHDLLQDKPPGLFDLVVCRNLLIFFRPEVQEKLLKKLIQATAEGGFLILGRSERINSDGSLEVLSSRFSLYQKIEGPEKKRAFLRETEK